MNEFTKEELNLLFDAISDCIDSLYTENHSCNIYEFTNSIKSKLKFLIDNYDAQVIEAWHCEKCGHVQ
jgi:hypothetical protein